jgi:ABC-type transport system involved in multi-copper enzyme maturation permease subunit
MGQMFFAFFTVFSVTAMAALGPVLTSTAISAERLGKTLHVLLMTPITTWQIIAGKLFSRLLVALTLIGLSLPALALVRLLGGVELVQMAGVVCLCVATVLSTASIGLLFSTFMNRAYAAILLSYGMMLLLYVFLPFVLYFGFELSGGAYAWVYDWINWMSCAVLLAEPRGMPQWTDWAPCVGVHLGLSAVLVTASALILRRTSRRAGEGRGAAPAAASAAPGGQAVEETAVELPPARAAQDASIVPPDDAAKPPARARDVSDQPVLWRELRRPLMAKSWQTLVGAAASVVLLLVTYVVLVGDGLLDEEWSHAGYAWMFNLVVWLLTAVLAATAIAQEKESDTWTLLLTTPLSGNSIVWGKVLGLYRRLLWPGALIVTHFLAFTIAGVVDWEALALAVWVIFSFNSIWVATGIYLSLRCRKVTFAVIVNLLLAVGLYLVVFFVLLVMAELSRAHDLPLMVGWYLPYYYLGEGITTEWMSWGSEIARLPNNLPVTGNVFMMTVFVVGMIHLAAAVMLLQATAAAFDKVVGRARQTVQRRGFEALPAPPPGAGAGSAA